MEVEKQQKKEDRRFFTAYRLIFFVTAIGIALAGVLCRKDIFAETIPVVKKQRQIELLLIWAAGVAGVIIFPYIFSWKKRFFSILFFLLSPFWIFLNMEIVTTVTIPENGTLQNIIGVPATTPKLFWINILLVFLLVFLFTVLTDSFCAGPMLAEFLCVLFSVVNLYVTEFRGNAISAPDFMTVGTAMEVAGEYRVALHYRVYLGILIAFVFYAAAFCLRRAVIVHSVKAYLPMAAGGTAIFAAAFYFLVLTGFLKSYGIGVSYFNTMRSYRTSGTIAVLARSVQEAFPKVPEGYSVEAARKIAEAYPSDEAGEKSAGPSKQQPNVFVLIDESFTDLKLLGDFEVTEDYMPCVHSIKKNCVTGISYASVRGGMTANTEFEFLTGNTMGLLSASAVPFQIYVKNELPSMATSMAAQGYTGLHALHPYTPSNYNRVNAYPLLGFADFISSENLPLESRKIRKYTSDDSDFENMLYTFEKDREKNAGPYFFYTMTLQNHSPYDPVYENFPSTVHTTGLKRQYEDVDQYLTLIKASDAAFGKVVEYFEKLDEPTILLFVGDHQPKLTEGFFTEVTGGRRKERDEEGNMILYQVPFVIWANFDIGCTDAGETSMNYLQTMLIDSYGGRLTGYQKFLKELKKDIPVINAFGYYGADGKFYSTDDENSPYYEKVKEYAILQYNNLFDKGNRLEGFFDLV
ncbi:MAG: sulfatase-like hydrolase/transferase [Blautia sp.]|nr:sulfatase-like hydrolase/transferase [Blautia sp.]